MGGGGRAIGKGGGRRKILEWEEGSYNDGRRERMIIKTCKKG